MVSTNFVCVLLVVSMAIVTIRAQLPLAEADNVHDEQHDDNSPMCLVKNFLKLLTFHDGAELTVQTSSAQKHANHIVTWKCKPTQAGIEKDAAIYEECYKELMGIVEPVSLPKIPAKPTSDPEKKGIEECIVGKTKIINEDGSINFEKVHDQLKEIKIDDSVKELVEHGLEDCVTKGENVYLALDCVSKVLIEQCVVSLTNSTNVTTEHQ